MRRVESRTISFLTIYDTITTKYECTSVSARFALHIVCLSERLWSDIKYQPLAFQISRTLTNLHIPSKLLGVRMVGRPTFQDKKNRYPSTDFCEIHIEVGLKSKSYRNEICITRCGVLLNINCWNVHVMNRTLNSCKIC